MRELLTASCKLRCIYVCVCGVAARKLLKAKPDLKPRTRNAKTRLHRRPRAPKHSKPLKFGVGPSMAGQVLPSACCVRSAANQSHRDEAAPTSQTR